VPGRAKTAGISRRGAWWVARFTVAGRAVRVRVGSIAELGGRLGLARRRALIQKAKEEAGLGGPLGDFLEAVAAVHESRAPRGHAGVWQILRGVARLLGPVAMGDVTVPMAEDLAARLAGSGLKGRGLRATTLRRYVKHLSGVWRMAVERGWAERDPWRGLRLPKPVQRPVPALTAEERARLLGACSVLLRAFVGLLLETGLRYGEAAALRWGDVDMGGGWLTVRRSKSGRPRTLKLTAAAHRILDELGDGVGPIFSTAPKLREFQLACAAADLPRLRFHDCRHIAAVRMARAGATVLEISKVLGHQTVTQSAYYAEHNPTELGASAIAKLDAHD